VKPKADPNHPGDAGPGEDRTDERELTAVEASLSRVAETMVVTAMTGRTTRGIPLAGLQELDILAADTLTPEYRRHPPRSLLTDAERGNPVVVWSPLQ
jgi:hypothetical protein